MKTFKIRLMRETEAGKEYETVSVEDEGASEAYVKAMKIHNHAEGWTPVSFETAGGENRAAGQAE